MQHCKAILALWTCSQGVHLADCRQAILTDRLDFKRSCWTGISDEAKDFVQQLLQREPGERRTAREALQHPWLLGGTVEERNQGKPLSLSAVQRIQVTCLPSLLHMHHRLWYPAGDGIQSKGLLLQSGPFLLVPAQPACRQAALPCANREARPSAWMLQHRAKRISTPGAGFSVQDLNAQHHPPALL